MQKLVHLSSVLLLLAALTCSVAEAAESLCQESASSRLSWRSMNARALLQRKFTSTGTKLKHDSKIKELTSTNPSGAAAPLNEEGYSAVADRCCLAEMKVFVERVIFDQSLQMCEPAGLEGFVPWHSCQTTSSYSQLVAHLLEDSQSQCPWVQPLGDNCQALPKPPICEEFPNLPPHPPCSCSRAQAAIVDLSDDNAKLEYNNLAGQGPNSGQPEELRISGTPSAGTIPSTGQKFDISITTVGSHQRGTPYQNGLRKGSFGKIFIAGQTSSTFKFSFVEPGTNTPVVVPEIHMAVFDLDGGGSAIESTSSKGYAGYVTHPTPDLTASKLPDGRTEFTGTIPGSDPTTANDMTEAQQKSSIMFFYTDVSSFELNFASSFAGGQSGLLFAFESALNERCGD